MKKINRKLIFIIILVIILLIVLAVRFLTTDKSDTLPRLPTTGPKTRQGPPGETLKPTPSSPRRFLPPWFQDKPELGVVSTQPDDQEIDVEPLAVISITFNRSVASSDITFVISPAVPVTSTGGEQITHTFTPQEAMAFETTYTVMVSVQDQGQFNWQFRTRQEPDRGGIYPPDFLKYQQRYLEENALLQLFPVSEPEFAIEYIDEQNIIVHLRGPDYAADRVAANQWLEENSIEEMGVNVEFVQGL